MLEDLDCVIAPGELRNRIVHDLVLFVLQLQRDNRQTIQEENEINLGIRVAEIEMRPKRDAVLVIKFGCDTFARTRFRIVEPKLQPTHLQAMSDEQPEG